MTPIVNSRFDYLVWASVIFCLIVVVGFTTALIVILIWHRDPGGLIVGCGLFVLTCFAINNIINSLIVITVAPDELRFKYIVTGKQTIINYADIAHVENVHTKSVRRSNQDEADGVRLNIFLKNGDEFTFYEDNYTNYDELKEAIRRNRFHLDD